MIYRIAAMGVLLAMLSACGSVASNLANPERALANYIQLGRGYLSEGEIDQARFNILKALEVDSRSPEANDLMGSLMLTQGEVELARQHYVKAIAADRNYTAARMNLARILYGEENYGSARDQYRVASEDINYRLRANAFYGLAVTELQLGRKTESEAALRRALQLNPNLSAALIEVAEISFTNQDYAGASQYLDRYEHAAAESPRSLALGIKLAEVYQDDTKLRAYQMALRTMFPDSNEALTLLPR